MTPTLCTLLYNLNEMTQLGVNGNTEETTGLRYRRTSDLDWYSKGELIPFGWQQCVGTVSKPLHRRAAGRWVNLHLSAAGRTAGWQHGGGTPLMRQGNLKDTSHLLTNSADWLADWLHIHSLSLFSAYPRWQIWCFYVFQSAGHTHSPQSRLQCEAGSSGPVCPSRPPHVPLRCKPPPLGSSWLCSAPHAQGPWSGTTCAATCISWASLMSSTQSEQAQILQYYLKLGCGVILGVFPSMTPRSLMVRDPPGSSRALRRSRTEALSTGYVISTMSVLLYISCWSPDISFTFLRLYLTQFRDNHFLTFQTCTGSLNICSDRMTFQWEFCFDLLKLIAKLNIFPYTVYLCTRGFLFFVFFQRTEFI